jgi:hypothetical protein
MYGLLADMPARAMDALEERLESRPEHIVVVRAAQPPLGTKLHILYAASGARQSREFVRKLADVLADERLQDGGEIQFLFLDELLLFGTGLAKVQLLLLTVDDVGQMHRGRARATLAFHPARAPVSSMFAWAGRHRAAHVILPLRA